MFEMCCVYIYIMKSNGEITILYNLFVYNFNLWTFYKNCAMAYIHNYE